jgi:hypothetical protein
MAQYMVLAISIGALSAASSNFSPCSLSMVSNLNPVTQKAKGCNFRISLVIFFIGSIFGSTLLVGLSLLIKAAPIHPDNFMRTVFLLIVVLIAFFADIGLIKLPATRRQLNEIWLTSLRRTVYCFSYGFQLGCAFVTYLTSYMIYALVAVFVLNPPLVLSIVLAVSFSVMRSASLLIVFKIKSIKDLRRHYKTLTDLAARIKQIIIWCELILILLMSALLNLQFLAALSLIGMAIHLIINTTAKRRVRYV